MQSEFQDPKRGVIAHFAIGPGRCEQAMTFPARASHKFTNSILRISSAGRSLRRKALVVVVMPGYHDIGVSIVERLKERLNFRIVSVRQTRTEQGLVEISEGAGGGMRGQVVVQPSFFARAGVAAGLPEALAMKLACETVSGAGELLHRSELSAATLRQNVTSPAGTTAAALEVLMGEDGLQSLLTRAIAAATKRSKELAK